MTTGRLEAFSDGVIAVAITLLVLSITPPTATSADEVWRGSAMTGRSSPPTRSRS